MKARKFAAVCAAAVIALAGATTATIAQDVVPNAGNRPANAPPPKPVGPGPYEVTMYSDPSMPTHTVYRPTDLSKFGPSAKLPIIGWGNGGCLNGGKIHETFLRKIASHGYFVVAIGAANVGVDDLTPKTGPMPEGRRTEAKILMDGVTWAIAENTKKGSAYAGKLDTNAIGVMGQSCGGSQAIAVSKDPRVKTTIVWNSGAADVPPRPNPRVPASPTIKVTDQSDLKTYHAPVAYFIGGPSDTAYERSEKDFTLIEGVPVFNANLNVGHGGTYNQPNGGWFGEVGVAWLDWQLKGSKEAAKYFTGEKCGLCTEKDWTIKRKNIK